MSGGWRHRLKSVTPPAFVGWQSPQRKSSGLNDAASEEEIDQIIVTHDKWDFSKDKRN
jgi:hypothetical protein